VIIQNDMDRIITCQSRTEIPAPILVYKVIDSFFECTFSFFPRLTYSTNAF